MRAIFIFAAIVPMMLLIKVHSIKITVQVASKTFEVHAGSDDTVGFVKRSIHSAFAPHQQTVHFGGSTLRNDALTLEQAGIVDDSHVVLQ